MQFFLISLLCSKYFVPHSKQSWFCLAILVCGRIKMVIEYFRQPNVWVYNANKNIGLKLGEKQYTFYIARPVVNFIYILTPKNNQKYCKVTQKGTLIMYPTVTQLDESPTSNWIEIDETLDYFQYVWNQFIQLLKDNLRFDWTFLLCEGRLSCIERKETRNLVRHRKVTKYRPTIFKENMQLNWFLLC